MKTIIAKWLPIIALILVVWSGEIALGQNNDPSVADDPNFSARQSSLKSLSTEIAQKPRISDKDKVAVIEYMEKEALSGNRSLILPSKKYFDQFSIFLRNKNTGLARIFPDIKCDRGMVVTVSELERCADTVPMPGNASYYSFRLRTNLATYSDLHFIDNTLVASEMPKTFGLISEIGKIQLESLTIKSEAVKFLNDYKPKTKTSELQPEVEIFRKGVIKDNFTYALSAPLKLNSTYLLRFVAYEYKNSSLIDNRKDNIVAFTVVGKESDGSLILLWTILKSKDAVMIKN